MPALQVRDFPEELYNQLRSCAAEQDRSISQQTTYVLRRFLEGYQRGMTEAEAASAAWDVTCAGAAGPSARTERRRRSFMRLEASFEGAPGPDSLPSSVDMIREMREERDDHLLSLLRNGQED